MRAPVKLSAIEIDFLKREIQELSWFVHYLNAPGTNFEERPAQDFAAVIKEAIEKYGIRRNALAERFAVNKGTVSRWENAVSAPQPFARPVIVEWIKDTVQSRIDTLVQEIGNLEKRK